MRLILSDQISALMKLLVATEMTGGRFHRIGSSAAAKCTSAPQVARFSHGLGQKRKLEGGAARSCTYILRTDVAIFKLWL